MRFAFRFRWIPFVATVLVMCVGIALGEWQRGRALQKEGIAAMLAERSVLAPVVLRAGESLPPVSELEYRQVVADGEFLADWPVYLDNRPHGGVPGFYLVMPFRIGSTGPVVLVSRGWLPRDPQERTRLPHLRTPRGTVTVRGTIRRHPGQVLQLGQPAAIRPNAILQNLSPADFAAASGIQVLSFIIEQAGIGVSGPDADGLVRDWPQPSFGSDKHRGYAFQWYALAATALLFFLVTGFRSGTK
ncbi:SURF1 family protein [Lacisediminimonas profundi]|uniref:SURF1 family protein n=1 Tax=Lacisediminimonas profundi TaxID=2603856 RepID=UPI00124B839F|nr:SURF1 family protein [Lacisediminimonas profundi]